MLINLRINFGEGVPSVLLLFVLFVFSSYMVFTRGNCMLELLFNFLLDFMVSATLSMTKLVCLRAILFSVK